jgi:hypothetical protein
MLIGQAEAGRGAAGQVGEWPGLVGHGRTGASAVTPPFA